MSTQVKEYRWVLIVSILIVLLGSLPLIVGYALQTPDQRFVGTMYDRQDYAVHFAAMQHGAQGNWDYQIRFSTEPLTPTYLKTFYVALGHLNGWMGIPFDVIFQAARILLGLLACISIYRLLTRIFPAVNQRRLAFVLAILGAGLGWVQVPLGLLPDPKIWPIDIWLIDAYVFFSIALFPHFSALIIAMTLALTAFLDHLQRPDWRNVVVMALCALFAQILNPVVFALADFSMAGAFVFACWQKRRFDWASALTLVFLAIIQIPLLLYSWNLLTRDPSWAVFSSQNFTPSPPPVYVLFGFGLFWPFAIVGAIRAARKPEAGSGLAFSWVAVALILAYLPVEFQRRFLLGITVPLTILATPVILDFSAWLHRRARVSKAAGAIMVGALISLGSLFLVLINSANVASRPPNLFEPAALVQALDWLGQNGAADDAVLASEPTAQMVAIRTPLRLYFGHEMETLHFADKAREVEAFYRGQQPESWLASLPVTWVVFGPHEREWSSTPPRSPRLKLAYQNEQVSIYRMVHP
ncbi:MAG: hypothetical protein WA821_23435 [Anaerolineales bacterium]